MARQITILEQRLPADPESGGEIQFRAVFWLTTPAARVSMYAAANATMQSAIRDGTVSAPELAALQNGTILEVVDTFRFASGTAIATIQSALVAEFTARQAALTAETRLRRYGSTYDGSSWTLLNKV